MYSSIYSITLYDAYCYIIYAIGSTSRAPVRSSVGRGRGRNRGRGRGAFIQMVQSRSIRHNMII